MTTPKWRPVAPRPIKPLQEQSWHPCSLDYQPNDLSHQCQKVKSKSRADSTLSAESHSAAETKMTAAVIEHPFLSYLRGYPVLAAPTYQLLDWDTSLCIRINRFSSDEHVAAFFKSISRLGDGWFWGLMVLSALAIKLGSGAQSIALWAPLLTVVMTSLMGVGLYKVLKVKTVRPRPYQVHQVIIMGERPLDVFSFPSGHTLQAVLYTCVLGSYFPILLWVMVPFAILVALSRMVLGLHYPTDVAVGAGLGVGLAQLSPLIEKMVHTVLI